MSFKLYFRCGYPPLCSGVIVVPSGPKSHTFTVILAVFAPSQDGVINREKVYYVAQGCGEHERTDCCIHVTQRL